MALLNFANLGRGSDPHGLMKSTFDGLSGYYKYLQQTKTYLESEAAVLRLAWKLVKRKKKRGKDKNLDKLDGQVWIELIEPKDRLNEPERTFWEFLDDGTSEVYEALPPKKKERGEAYQKMDFGRERVISVLDRDPKRHRLLLERPPEKDFTQLLLRPNTYPLSCQLYALKYLQNTPHPEHFPLLQLLQPSSEVEWDTSSLQQLDPYFYDYLNSYYGNEESIPVEPEEETNWHLLSDSERPGTSEQREFVNKARKTPDFAVLEGPPGSGKTTAICELILQLVLEGKRVLLCASTHVAVDNVLERLMDGTREHEDIVIPVRIGDKKNVSDAASKWQLEKFIQTEGKRLREFLSGHTNPTKAQSVLHEALGNDEKDLIQRLVLESANLVCGTTIGILQHPTIKKNKKAKHTPAPDFDVLIIDEASKTTFQEFLVPALLAKRWIVVGDPRQLSPYVDDKALATNVEACLQEPIVRNACIDVYIAGQQGKRRRTILIVDDSKTTLPIYRIQAESRGVAFGDLSEPSKQVGQAAILVGTTKQVLKNLDRLPLDLSIVKGGNTRLDPVLRRVSAYRSLAGLKGEEERSWQGEVAWRLAIHFEQRLNPGASSERLFDQVQRLLPAQHEGARESGVWRDIDQVRRIALPSILELLKDGFHLKEIQSTEDLEPGMVLSGVVKNITDHLVFVNLGLGRDGAIHISNLVQGFVKHPSEVVERGQRITVEVLSIKRGEKTRISLSMKKSGCQNVMALTEGLPHDVFRQRHVLLEYQHRMHPEISAFSREHIYEGQALRDPFDMEERREWKYNRYAHRSAWIDVRGEFDRRSNRNTKEAEVLVQELKEFHEWVQGAGSNNGSPWKVAIITFYRGQEKEIRHHLREMTGSFDAFRSFVLGVKDRPEVVVELCTVDRFQGHEADLVFLSFANTYPTVFLQSPNRLNVALTRARYQCVIVGNRAMLRGRGRRQLDAGPVLGALLGACKTGYRWDTEEEQ